MNKVLFSSILMLGLTNFINADWECIESKVKNILAGSSHTVYSFPNSNGWHGINFNQVERSSTRALSYKIYWANTKYGLDDLDWKYTNDDFEYEVGVPTDKKWDFYYAGDDDIAFKIVFQAQSKYDMPITGAGYNSAIRWTDVSIRYQVCQNGMD